MIISELVRGQQIEAGCGLSTVVPEMDFETFSGAGFIWDEATKAYRKPPGAKEKGIFAVGAVVYTEYPDFEAMCLAYDLKDRLGPRLWIPGTPPPQDLFDYLATGGPIEAVNCQFEYWVWKNYCAPVLGWPELPWHQLNDAAAKFRAHGYPGALGPAAEVSGAIIQKMTEGKRLIKKFGCPQKPTRKDPRHRIRPEEEPGGDGQLYYDYCLGDIAAESAVSMLCPDLSPEEKEYELYTRATNVRGIALDMVTVNAGVKILNQALVRYDAELKQLTNGAVEKGSQGARIITWLATMGTLTPTLDKNDVKRLLETTTLHPAVRRALTIRQLVGSAGVKKLYAMQRMVSREGRVHDLVVYHGAKTGRDNGRDLQPLNLVKAGPGLHWCHTCGEPSGADRPGGPACPYCGNLGRKETGWKWEAADKAIEAIRTGSLDTVERIFGSALLTLSGCIRSLFTASDDHELICSDYSSIEAVVTAMLAGEEWRIEAFRNKEDIYLHSASRVTGISYEEYKRYAAENGHHHPDRQKIGKPRELALGFQGWIGAYRQFDSTDNYTDEEVTQGIIQWRDDSPAIVELWGGQVRGVPWSKNYELYGLEGAAINAIKNPGQVFSYRGLSFGVKDDIMYGRLLSGRLLTYHKPRLSPHHRWDDQLAISFEGWNTNPKKGKIGWIRMSTYGGDLAQSCISEKTLVLTENGWKTIENISKSEKVHDGVDFVAHGGILNKGIQTCTVIDGVLMTPDHEVLTYEGWKTASQEPELYRPEIRRADCFKPRNERREKTKMGIPLRLWGNLRKSGNRCHKSNKARRFSKLWMSDKEINVRERESARTEQTPSASRLGLYARALLSGKKFWMEKIWRSWDLSRQRVAVFFRNFLGRHGADVCFGFTTGSAGQRRELLQKKLSMGNTHGKWEQQKHECEIPNPRRTSDNSRSESGVWYRDYDVALSFTKQMARKQDADKTRFSKSRVLDILDAGPRQRFVIMGIKGPFIVHNCIQATARDFMFHAIPHLWRAGYPIVLRVHDELVGEVPTGTGSIEEFERIMGTAPAWAEGWPIRAAGGWRGKRYRKD